MPIDAMYRCWMKTYSFETFCTVYLCLYQKRLFPALLKKVALNIEICEVYKKAGRYLQQKLCPFEPRVSFNVTIHINSS